jgi:hypothetical protein
MERIAPARHNCKTGLSIRSRSFHVARSPWTAADAPVGLRFEDARQSRTRGPGADEGVRPPKLMRAYPVAARFNRS